MPQRQKVLLLVAAVVVLAVAVFAIPRGEDEEPTSTASGPVATTTAPSSTATTTVGTLPASERARAKPTAPKAAPLLRAGGDRQLTFRKGDRVRFRVRSTTADEVHVHGYDLKRDLPAGKTVTVSFKATITGIFEVELEGTHVALGTLRVNP